MARVLHAIHEELDLPVAVKVLKEGRTSAPDLERLRQEARAIARLRGPHVVRVLDSGDDPESGRFIVMELVDGRTLADVIAADGRLAPERAARLGAQIAEALAEAHASGIVHRDVKPANVLVTSSADGVEHAKVTDFGIAKTAWSESLALTESSAFLGSPKYMSPEQLVNPQTVDARTDVWSFGVVLFEMLTGRLPFEAYTPGALLAAILNEEPRSLRELCPDVPPALEEVVRACLVKDARERCPTIDEARTRLVTTESASRTRARRWVPYAAAGVGVAAIALGRMITDRSPELPPAAPSVVAAASSTTPIARAEPSSSAVPETPAAIASVAGSSRAPSPALSSRAIAPRRLEPSAAPPAPPPSAAAPPTEFVDLGPRK